MTKTVKVQEAKTHLSALLAAVESGEDIVIARGDVPVARLVAIAAGGKRSLGGLEYHLEDDFFDDLPEEELAAWEG
jgi:prevent-host-death family protein